MDDTKEGIEIRRLEILEKQAALYGPQTEPAVLIEIAELKHKKRSSSDAERRQFVSGLDYQFLMDVVAAALIRLGTLERNQSADSDRRWLRQLIHDVWMVAITVIVLVTLALQLRGH